MLRMMTACFEKPNHRLKEEECPICIEELTDLPEESLFKDVLDKNKNRNKHLERAKNAPHVVHLPCNHQLHGYCAIFWAFQSSEQGKMPSCPTCRQSYKIEDVEGIYGRIAHLVKSVFT